MSHYQSPYQMKSSVNYDELQYDIDPLEIAAHSDDFVLRRQSSTPDFRRWSVIDKVKSHYGHYRINDPHECGKLINGRCVLGVMMLVVFITLVVLFFRVILFNINLGPITYDFIIVGGGPAGCIIARKLSDVGAKVLLLEAGKSTHKLLNAGETTFATSMNANDNNLVNSIFSSLNPFDIPFLWSSVGNYPNVEWKTTGDSDYRVAQTLGGNSMLSAMIYLRALPTDIFKWDLSSVSWSKMLETYLLQENYRPIGNNSIPPPFRYHGKDGYLSTTENDEVDDISQKFIESALNSQIFSFNPDFNDPSRQRNGIGFYQFNILEGIRSNVLNNVIRPMFHPNAPTNQAPNKNSNPHENSRRVNPMNLNKLTIQLNAQVKKVLLENIEELTDDDGDSYKAFGVTYEVNGKTFTATLSTSTRSLTSTFSSVSSAANIIPWKRNVILTAGTLLTPAILMNSGIGSCKKNINTMKLCSEMIGERVQDNPSIYLIYKIKEKLSSTENPSLFDASSLIMNYLSALSAAQSHPDLSPLPSGRQENKLNDFGVFGTSGFSVGGFMTSPYALEPSVPDVQITLFPSATMLKAFSRKIHREWDKLTMEGLAISVSLLQPDIRYQMNFNQNRSEIHPPEITSLSSLSEKDLLTFLWATEKIRTVFSHQPIKEMISHELLPGQNVTTDEYSRWIKSNVFTLGNWVGSVPMGKENNENFPVDEKFKLRGVKGLIVADASVIPAIPNGNIHATVSAMSSIAADLILENEP